MIFNLSFFFRINDFMYLIEKFLENKFSKKYFEHKHVHLKFILGLNAIFYLKNT